MAYTKEQTEQIKGFMDKYNGEVIPRTDFLEFLEEFEGVSEQSLASKIRFMGGKVEPKGVTQVKKFTAQDEQIIREMTANPNNLPYLEEIAERLGKGWKQVRGKLVSMRIKGIKKRDIKEKPAPTFSEEQKTIIRRMASAEPPAYLEDIAEKLGFSVPQIKGILASMRIKGVVSKNSKPKKEKIYTDELKAELRELVKSHTIEEIAEMKNLNFFGLRSILGKMGLIEKKSKQVYWTEDRVAELKALMEQGLSVDDIAKKMDKNSLVIAKQVKKLERMQKREQVEECSSECECGEDFDSISV